MRIVADMKRLTHALMFINIQCEQSDIFSYPAYILYFTYAISKVSLLCEHADVFSELL